MKKKTQTEIKQGNYFYVYIGFVVMLSLGRRLVSLLTAAQRAIALADGVDGRTRVLGGEFISHRPP